MGSEEETPKIQFKKKIRKPLRKREALSDDDDSESEKTSLRYISHQKSIINNFRYDYKVILEK